MKKLIVFLPFLFFIKFLSAQTTTVHDSNAEKRTVTSFHGIEVSNGIDLSIKQGNDEAVAVSGSTADITSRIKTEVKNGILKIYFDNTGLKNWKNNKQLKAYVSFKTLDKLSANSGASTTTDGGINVTNLDIEITSGAGFYGTVTASKLNIEQNSGSQMKIIGKVNDLDVSTSSGANFSGYDLVAENCNAMASSGAGIEITVNKDLKAIANSGGGIDYKGNATASSISNGSGGRIKKQG